MNMAIMNTPSSFRKDADSETEEGARIAAIVDEVSHLLPGQAPLHAFVHHNTLHAFENLPFETAIVEAARLFGTEPFQSEEAFANSLASVRIQVRDIEAVVDESGMDLGVGPGHHSIHAGQHSSHRTTDPRASLGRRAHSVRSIEWER